MAQRSETAAVYTAGVIQGLALVTFPAASRIFTNPSDYGLSSTQYGAMFLPQAITAVVASLLGAGLTQRVGIKRIYLFGLTADLISMALLIASVFVMANQPLAYGLLLVATASLGIGFGLTVPSLNTFAAAFFPEKTDRAVLVLNALLGLGTALAPVLVAVFFGLGIWWGLPVLSTVLLLGLLLFSMRLPLQAGAPPAVGGKAAGADAKRKANQRAAGRRNIPATFWIFAAFALLYGIVETINGNWATLYMTNDMAASAAEASLALTAFWGMVTIGRILFAAIDKWLPERRTYHILPFVAAAAFAIIAFVPMTSPMGGILVFGLSGLGCSALLPLTISFGQEDLTTMVTVVAGYLIAAYQIGYGIAAFGVGPLEDLTGLSLRSIYGLAIVVAVAMGIVSFFVTRKPKAA